MHFGPFGRRLAALTALVVLIAGLAVSIADDARAEDVRYVYRLRDTFALGDKKVNAPPAEKLFNESEFREYQDLIRRNECPSALRLIRKALDKVSPISRNMSKNKSDWPIGIAAKYYQDEAYCSAIDWFSREQNRINKSELGGWFFQEDSKSSDRHEIAPLVVIKRNFAIVDLLLLAFEDYPPAQLTLVRLSEKGEAIRLTKGFAYYLLARAKILGATDTDLGAMLEKAGAQFQPDERARLDQFAAAGEWPRDERLVLD